MDRLSPRRFHAVIQQLRPSRVPMSRSTSLTFTHWRTQRQSCRRTDARACRLIQTTSFRSPIIWMSDNRAGHRHNARYKRTSGTVEIRNVARVQECCGCCGCRRRANAICADPTRPHWVYSSIDSDHTRSAGPSGSDSRYVRTVRCVCVWLVTVQIIAYCIVCAHCPQSLELHRAPMQIMKRMMK